jgi:hypothetical protein
MLVTLEKYLLQNLRASDVVTGEDGVLLFNVNQVSYIVEGSVTKAEQKDSKKKIKDTTALMSMRTCVRTGNCKSFVLCIGQTDIDSMCFFLPRLVKSGVCSSPRTDRQKINKKIIFGLCQCKTQINTDMFCFGIWWQWYPLHDWMTS